MNNEWKEYKLGDVVNFKRGFDLPIQDRTEGMYPIVASNGVAGYHNEYKVKGPGVSMGRSGTLGKIFYTAKDYWPLNTSLYVEDFKGNDKKFIFYLLQTIDFGNYNAGSGVPTLNRNHIHPLPVILPPLPEQKRIAEILSSLDDKIELNNKMNKNLEEIAQAIFKQWFVDFEYPDENGNPYKSSGGKMIQSELGEIPEGWSVGKLTDIISIIGGGTPKTSVNDYWNGNVPWISGGDITSNHKSFIIKTEKSITELGLKNSSARLLPKFTSVISARGTVGKYCLLSEQMAFSQSNYGIVPKTDKNNFYSYLLLGTAIDRLQSYAYGSVFDTITTKVFESYDLIIPRKKIIQKFEEFIDSYFLKILLNKRESESLIKTRDSLLPKLMSGELRV